MFHGSLRNVLHEVTGSDVCQWPFWNDDTQSMLSSHSAASFLDSTGPMSLISQPIRGTHSVATSFTDAGNETTSAPEEPQPGESPQESATDAQVKMEEDSEKDATNGSQSYPGWTNTGGIPNVTTSGRNENYFSDDIAQATGDGNFKPIFGCKCNDWQPAPTHPQIKFRDTFTGKHPAFFKQLQKLKVHMEDTTAKKVHWDAVYDLKHFMTPKDIQKAMQPGGSIGLNDTTPAEPGSGTNLRFMTFCPPESGGQPHEYSLKVTALDASDKPIDGMIEEETRYTATPSPPPYEGPIVATANPSAAMINSANAKGANLM